MKENRYDDQLIIEYLLGTLSEDETERLDELSFTDDRFAARLQAVENDLVDSFVRGELSGESLDSFNSHYLGSPKRREKVAFARRFQSYADRAVITEPSVKDRPAPRKGFLYGFFSVPRPALQWGLAAATLLMLVAVGWLAIENLRLQNQVNQAQAERNALERREQELEAEIGGQRSSGSEKERELESVRERLARLEEQMAAKQNERTQPSPAEAVIIPFTLAPQMRGINQVATISIPPDADYVSIRLELEPGDFVSYRAELKAQPEGRVVWRSGRLRAVGGGENKAVSVTIPASLLMPQTYIVEVSGVSPAGISEPIGSYPFRVVK